MSWVSRLVSILVIASVVVALGMCIRRKMPVTEVGQNFKTCAAFRDGSKISTGSPVMIAGIRIGDVSGLSIEGDYARIEMLLRDDAQIPIDSWVTKRAYSPFGDSYLEIIPSGSEAGAVTGQLLRPGQCLMRVAEGASTDRLLRTMVRSLPRMEDGLERMSEVAQDGRKWTVGMLEEKAFDAEHWLDEGRIAAPLRKAERAMARVESAATTAATAVHGANPAIDRTFDKIESGVATARKKMAEVRVDLSEGMRSAREGMNDVDKTIDDVTEVVAALDEGRGSGAQGTIGRLINDPTLHDDIEEATESARSGVGSFNRFKSWLGLRIEFNIFSRAPRFFVTAEISARNDVFYLVELERGPLGDFPDDMINDVPGVPTYTRQQVIKDGVRFTAQFGKRFDWFQIRGGLKESTFGFGADIVLGHGRLKLSSDLYGGVFKTPRLKLAGALAVARSIYLIAGVDDALNEPKHLQIRKGDGVPTQFDKLRYGRDYFLGATLHFDDADLALLIRVYGALLVGLL